MKQRDGGKKSTGRLISFYNLLEATCYLQCFRTQGKSKQKNIFMDFFSQPHSVTCFLFESPFGCIIFLIYVTPLFSNYIFESIFKCIFHLIYYFSPYFQNAYTRITFPRCIIVIIPFKFFFFSLVNSSVSPSGSQNYFWQCWGDVEILNYSHV